MDFIILLAFIIYFAVVLGIGFYFYKRTRSMSDYVLGGRSMNPYVTAMSAQASDMSGWLLMGLPGAIYLAGIGEIWIGIGLAIGSYLAWLFVAKRLRKYSERCGNALTVSAFFSNRFKDDKGYLKVFSAVVILFFFTIYVASGFVSGGKLFNIIFNDISFEVTVIVTAVVIVSYTFAGGFKAVCWTDLLQALLMLVALIVVPLVALGHLDGGWDSAVSLFNTAIDGGTDIMWDGGNPITFVAFVSCIAWGLGYVGMPHILVRYMAIKDPEEVKIARRIGTLWVVMALASVGFIAIIGRSYLQTQGIAYADASGSEKVFIAMIDNLFAGSAPIVAGLLYSAILAAIMSTADSQLLVASSAVTNDIYDKMSEGKERMSDEKLMWISRIAVVVIALVGMAIALSGNNSIMKLVSFAWAGFGSSFGPLMVLALFWKRMNRKGAVASMLTGFLLVILWNTFFVAGGVFAGIAGTTTCIMDTRLYEMIPAFLLALIIGIVVSLATEEPSDEIRKEFDDATEGKFW